jgi:hypothetical protein
MRQVMRCACASGTGMPRLVPLVSMGDRMGNFMVVVDGELRNINWGCGQTVVVPADVEGGRPALQDCLQCLGKHRLGNGCSCFVKSVDMDGEVSGYREAERGFRSWSTSGNKKEDLLGLVMSSGSHETGFGPGDRPPPEDFGRPSFPPHRSTNSWTEP